ncbi:MAG: cytochrome b pre-mRNA-processing protein 3 [Hyphomicrobiaceae bacterium]|jgi:cytochrome b pre-mRNA-processing protein 3
MLDVFDGIRSWFRTWIWGRTQISITATELYGSIVTQARLPVFYTDYGVSDVAEKRYEMIVLHIVLVLERLRGAGGFGMELSRELVEVFVSDLDGSIREMAIGDTKVPNNVKKAAAGLLDRDVLYREAFDAGTEGQIGPDETVEPDEMTLDALLDELVFNGEMTSRGVVLADYVRAARTMLSGWKQDDGVAQLKFADPKTIVAE